MMISRLAMGTLALLGVAVVANPGCSSNNDGEVTYGMGDGGAPHVDGSIFSDTGVAPDGPGHLMSGQDAHSTIEAATSKEAGFSDAKPKVDGMTCVADAGGPGPVQHICIIFPAGADDGNECDGNHDAPGFPANGTMGNGFDDNCNGLVDEGCACQGVGTTKPCYLVPASQTVVGAPVGWCAQNSKGTVNCAQQGEGAPTWSGQCRGASPPYADDICAPGDFNCDGKDENSTADNCACQTATIVCPTAPVVTVPYPPPGALPLEVNAASWFSDPSAVAMATNWQWTLTGGDCDNILPHPTFGMYPTPNGTGAPVGTENDTLGTNSKEHGIVATDPQLKSVVYPAFSLSGDYLLDASWTLNGKQYTCSVQVQVRAPGLRAEGCWSTEGTGGNSGDDVDLHMAKVSNFPKCATEVWSDQSNTNTCENANEDCFYGDCVAGNLGGPTNWGYATSPASACVGWGSKATGTKCNNPRLDRDTNGDSECNTMTTDPNKPGPFCGAENINLDNPANGDVFAVAMRFYAKNSPTGTNPHVHANIYCDGARIYTAGYDPVAGNQFPVLITDGGDTTGDMWKIGLVTTQVSGGALTCTVSPTPSVTPDPMRDGTTSYCVDNDAMDGANSQLQLTSAGPAPTTAAQLCFH